MRFLRKKVHNAETIVSSSWYSDPIRVEHMDLLSVIGSFTTSAGGSAKTAVSGVVDTAANTVTASAHELLTGMGVQVTTTGTVPGGLALLTTYYVIKAGANTFKLATSYANAVAGTAIDLTSIGVGTHTFTPVAVSAVVLASGAVDTEANVVTATSHPLLTGMEVQLTTTGTLPGGLALATTYWIIKASADTIKFATSYANAGAGTAIDLTAVGSGTHTITPVAVAAAALDSATDINATTDIFTKVAHGFLTGHKGQIATDTTLPAGLTAATDYWVIRATADTFKLAASLSDALGGTAIDITDVGTGIQTFTLSAIIAPTAVSGGIDTELNTLISSAHGLLTGHKLQVTTSGALPTGISALTNYWVIRVDAATFKIAASLSDALAGTAVDITALGTGNQTFTLQAIAAPTAVAGVIDVDANTIGISSHGYSTGIVGQLTTTTTLPAGLSLSTDYFVIRVDAATIKLASSAANALAGTAVDLTDLGAGTHTFTPTAAGGTLFTQVSNSDLDDPGVTGLWVMWDSSAQSVATTGTYRVAGDMPYRWIRLAGTITGGSIVLSTEVFAKGDK